MKDIPLHKTLSPRNQLHTLREASHLPTIEMDLSLVGSRTALRTEEEKDIEYAEDRIFVSLTQLDKLLEDAETAELDRQECVDVGIKLIGHIECFKVLLVPKFSESALFLALTIAQKRAHEAVMVYTRGGGSLQEIRDASVGYRNAVRQFI